MKEGLLISGLTLIALLALFNCGMIYDGGGIGLWVSGIFSAFGLPIPFLLLFIRSRSKWVLPTLFVALITLGLPMVISEFHFGFFMNVEYVLLPLNILLITLCVVSSISEAKSPVRGY